MEYRIIVENSNKTSSFVGSEWTSSQAKLLKDLLYFSGQGFFCRVETSEPPADHLDADQLSAKAQHEVRNLITAWSQKLATAPGESPESGTYRMAKRECLEELRAALTK